MVFSEGRKDWNIGIVIENGSPFSLKEFHDGKSRGLPGIVYVLFISDSEDQDFCALYAFPSLIDSSGWRWLDHNEPPPNTVEKLLRQLRDFLGPSGYAWMASWPSSASPAISNSGFEERSDRNPSLRIV
jgi:hypothetical protein